jgi:hypothetical protein
VNNWGSTLDVRFNSFGYSTYDYANNFSSGMQITTSSNVINISDTNEGNSSTFLQFPFGYQITTTSTGGTLNCFMESKGINIWSYDPGFKGITYDPGFNVIITDDTLVPKSYVDLHQLSVKSKLALPSPSTPGRLIYVSNDVGGAVVAFSDGTNWRRVTDRNIIS